MALKTDYLDDILNADINTRRKYNIIQNDDGTVSFEDVTEYSQVGTVFGAEQVNEITREVNRSKNELDEKISKNDIVDNLLSTATDLPVSAKQGNVLDNKKANVGDNDFTTNTLEEIHAFVASQTGKFYAGKVKLPESVRPSGYSGWFRCIWECQADSLSDSGLDVIAMQLGHIWHGYVTTDDSGNYVLEWNKLDNKKLTEITSSSGVTGKTMVSIGGIIDKASEIHVVTQAQIDGGVVRQCHTFNVRADITDTRAYISLGGYANANYNSFCEYAIDRNHVYLTGLFHNGVNLTDSAKTWVTYR